MPAPARSITQSWFLPRRGNVVGRVPAAVALVAALGALDRRLHPTNPFPEGSWQHDLFALDQGWLYGPVRVGELSYLTGLTPKRVERVLARLRRSGVVRSYRPDGWCTRQGVFYEVHLPVENPIQALTPSQVRARLAARERQRARLEEAEREALRVEEAEKVAFLDRALAETLGVTRPEVEQID